MGSDQENPKKRPRRSSPASSADSNMDWDPPLTGDGESNWSGGVDWEDIESESGDEEDSGGWESELESELFCGKMVDLASKMSPDEDWVPYRQQWLKTHRENKKCECTRQITIPGCSPSQIARPTQYIKGPDVASKSERT